MTAYDHGMLGEVLTAIATPFDDDGAVDFDAFQELAALPRRERLRRARRRRHDRRGPTLDDGEELDLFRAALEAVGDRATVVAGTGTNSTAHSVELTEQRARARRRRLPRRHAVLQQAAAARASSSTSRPIAAATERPVVVYNIPGRVVINIEPETMSGSPRSRTSRAVKQANDDLDAGAAHRRARASTCTPATTTSCFPFLELGGARRHLRPHARRRAAGGGAGPRCQRGRPRGRARRSTRSSRPPTTCSESRRNPIPIKAALNLLGHEVGGLRLPLVPPTERRWRRCATASRGSGCSSFAGLGGFDGALLVGVRWPFRGKDAGSPCSGQLQGRLRTRPRSGQCGPTAQTGFRQALLLGDCRAPREEDADARRRLVGFPGRRSRDRGHARLEGKKSPLPRVPQPHVLVVPGVKRAGLPPTGDSRPNPSH